MFRGVIEQPATTLNVIGGSNELGVVIAESTMGGMAELSADADAKILVRLSPSLFGPCQLVTFGTFSTF